MGRGAGNIIYQSLGGPVEKYGPGGPSLGLKEDILFLEIVYFCIFGGHGNKTNKTGARSARARTRGQNPLVSPGLNNEPSKPHTHLSGQNLFDKIQF